MGIRGSLTLLGVIHGATLMTFCSGTQLGPLCDVPIQSCVVITSSLLSLKVLL